MKTLREEIKGIVGKVVGGEVDITIPEFEAQGHFSTNIALRLAKERKKSPIMLAEELAPEIYASAPELFQKIEVAPPGFINFFLTHEAHRKALKDIIKAGKKFGDATHGKGKKVIVEYASLNIAKPLHVGYLRNISIGDAVANIYKTLGYKVIRWNYLGDWGTQFGKLIVAYRTWGDKKVVTKNPVTELVALYVKFHAEAKANPELEDEARREFKKLEEGNKENRALWAWFKKESLKEFAGALKALGVKFDVEIGESFFENAMKPIVAELIKKNIAVRSEGALIVPLDEEKLPPAMIEKSDGSSLYLTRDLANLAYRVKKYKPAKIVYVVGNEQSLHFEQVFTVAEKLGLAKGVELSHVKFGLVYAEQGQKFSTREGNVVLLESVIKKAKELALKVSAEKNVGFSIKEREKIAEVVSLGALKYANLRENRNSDVLFDWDKMLSFSGDSAPYLQYTYARLKSIIRKAGTIKTKPDFSLLGAHEELALIRSMAQFPHAILETAHMHQTNVLALYLYNLANYANKFYETTPIMKDPEKARVAARLLLIKAATETLAKGLTLLGIRVSEKI